MTNIQRQRRAKRYNGTMSDVVDLSKKVGLDPGSLVYTGEASSDRASIRLISFDEASINEKSFGFDEMDFTNLSTDKVHWLSVKGLSEIGLIEKIGTTFDIHVLTLEDVLNINQRPKFEDSEDYVFTVLKMVRIEAGELVEEQFSAILRDNVVISFTEGASPMMSKVAERLKSGKSRARRSKADYLYHVLLDAVIDNYLLVLVNLEEKVLEIETEMDEQESSFDFRKVHELRGQLHLLQRSVAPMKELAQNLLKSDYFEDETTPFLKDLKDHISQVSDVLKATNEKTSALMDLFLSMNSFRMNEVMKVLTIFATIFMPLTFITGIYGMNFSHMPFLDSAWGFWVSVIVMLGIGISMALYIKSKRWL
jgi:magnesium transporter